MIDKNIMQYHSLSSFNEAVAISNSSSGLVKYLAGGIGRSSAIENRTKSPDHLIDIKNIPGVKEITLQDGGYTRQQFRAQLTEHKELSKKWPGLVEGMELVGSAQPAGLHWWVTYVMDRQLLIVFLE